MKKLEYTVSFNTPAFLGDAEQQAQWRTPPFKALLRQWWRVAYAADHQYPVNPNGMRTEEGLLFGHAWLENDCDEEGRQVAARKSLVRMRLDKWEKGQLKNWPGPDVSVTHPEVKSPVGSQLYLGYGPLTFRNGTALKANAAIQSGEQSVLSIAVPDEYAPRLERALWLMDCYGTLGGRSRNGWGSFALLPLPLGEGGGEGAALAGSAPLRLWSDCLSRDWPHALGQDGEGALIWQTAPYTDWKALMRELAIVKIGLRTQNVFSMNTANGDKPIIRKGEQVGINHGRPQDRHWLSFPVTNHPVSQWGGNARLPNSLRFKVRALPDGKLAGVIFHVPCLPPSDFAPNRAAIERVWSRIHTLLNHLTPESDRTYRMIDDAARRAALKPQLDAITLQRIAE